MQEGDSVEVKSRRGHAIYPACVTDKIRPGCCFAPIHWNDLFGENLAINATTNEALDPLSKQPEFKFCAVQIVKVAAPVTAPPSASEAPTFVPSAPFFATDPSGPFTPAQKEYLQGFLTGLLVSGRGSPALARGVPPNAPFSEAQQMWTNGVLAGAFSSTQVPLPAPPASPQKHSAAREA